ncbi:MAG TPA: PEGA domain-containing protein [Candidatus Dormibacteraeota bacterium]|nr:PEGA domain-containing protein [Candidatus Dormibacteraeota bacterium]
MDYLDTKKQLEHRIILLVGYVLVAIAIVTASLVLLYKAYGFGIGKNGTVIQNGLTFFSSQPNPASIYINNQLEPVATNTRLALPAGIYHVTLSRSGYHDWQRTIELEGGSVEHFDYPFLFPKVLTTKKIQTYAAAPGLITQSPDQRWLLVEAPNSLTSFDVYDLKNPTKASIDISLPANLLSKATANESLKLDEWADDNQHVVLQHNYDGKTEFILLDRANPSQSVNLNTSLSISPSKLTLKNKKYDQYYVYDASTAALQTASLKSPTLIPVLQHVLAYQSYGDSTLLYVTGDGAPDGKVLVKLRAGSTTSTIRNLPTGTTYLVDLTKYNGVMYVAAGDTAGSKVYIFQDPAAQLAAQPGHAPVPTQVLHVSQPSYLSFSPNTQFIVATNGNYFGVYDIQNDNGYNYTTPETMDAPQTHATWMDGNRLAYVSGGKLVVFDYDNTNHQTLMTADSRYLPAFAPDYKNVYVLTPGTSGQSDLTQTSLLTAADR